MTIQFINISTEEEQTNLKFQELLAEVCCKGLSYNCKIHPQVQAVLRLEMCRTILVFAGSILDAFDLFSLPLFCHFFAMLQIRKHACRWSNLRMYIALG